MAYSLCSVSTAVASFSAAAAWATYVASAEKLLDLNHDVQLMALSVGLALTVVAVTSARRKARYLKQILASRDDHIEALDGLLALRPSQTGVKVETKADMLNECGLKSGKPEKSGPPKFKKLHVTVKMP